LKLPPPTLRTLADLERFASVDEVISWARSRPLSPIQPKVLSTSEGDIEIRMPWHPEYASAPGEGTAIELSSPLSDGPAAYVFRDGRFVPV
jgi:hypothetical protein